MFKYTPLDGSSIYSRDVLKYAFIAGIVLNVLYSLYLFSASGKFFGHSKTSVTEKYSSITKENYQTYLNNANLDFRNSSALFNEVEDAVKEKNADLKPNGVTYFPAYVPEGTLLYHSNGNGLIPSGLEWVAMDYEFSYNFAHLSRPNRNRGGKGPFKGGKDGKKPDDGKGTAGPGGPGGHWGHGGPGGGGGGPPGRDGGPAHLLSFEVVEPLDKLIYLGGASAAKGKSGDSDTQFLLSRMTSYDDFNERIGAQLICDWGNSDGRTLDGIIRLEVGFEIIICDFNDKLRLVQNLTFSNATDILEFPPELPAKEETTTEALARRDESLDDQRSSIIDIYETMASYEHLIAGESVYDGDSRIYLDFSKTITLINRTYISPDAYTRRIDKIPQDVNVTLLKDVSDLLKGPAFDPYSSTDWEVVTHRIVKKFTPILMTANISMNDYLNGYNMIFNKEDQSISDVSKQLEIIDTLAKNITAFTYNFIRRYTDNHYPVNSDEQIEDTFKMMVWDYAHPYQSLKTESDYLIWASITNVQTKIIEQLYTVFKLGRKILLYKYVDTDETSLLANELHETIVKTFKDLSNFIEELDWSFFYRCTDVCGYDEVCYVPSWGPSPLGWGQSDKLNSHHTTSDGIKRINKEFICMSPSLLAYAKN